MRMLSSIPLLLRTLFRRKTVEQELEEELRSHLEDEIEAGIDRGLDPGSRAPTGSPQAARRRAVQGTGARRLARRPRRRNPPGPALRRSNPAQEPGVRHDRDPVPCTRHRRQHRGVQPDGCLLLRPLPVSNPTGLRSSTWTENGTRSAIRSSSRSTTATPSLAHLRLGYPQRADARRPGPMLVPTVFGSGEFFHGLGVAPQLGRTFGPEDDRPGGGPNGPVVVIGDGFWSRRFGRNSSVLGQTIPVNGVSATVIGVMPAGFFGAEVGTAPDLFVPLNTARHTDDQSRCMDSTSCWFLRVMGRLKDSVSAEEAHANLRVLSVRSWKRLRPPGCAATAKPSISRA